ncbi:MAG: carboxypeptidase regulatory-like domain-containing protein, partial [Candidatus Sericytochromatia bacterium]|nr:carboxypeptidase regulatory-like domain-containing protein [Candidatus Sericytochromatia bacterium]
SIALLLALVACQAQQPTTGPGGGTNAASLPGGGSVPAGMGTIKGMVQVGPDGGSLVGLDAAGGRNYQLSQAATPAKGGKVTARSDSDTKEVEVGPDGGFALVVKAGAEYTLEAAVPDGKGGVTKALSPTPILVPLAQDPPIVDAASLVTRRTGSIQGLIELKDAKPGDSPEGADVFLTGGTSVVGKAGETGRFALTNVAEGSWNVVVAKPGYKRQVVKGVAVKSGRPAMLEAPVVLERDVAQPTGVTGTVQSSDGKAIIGATVSVYPKDRKAIANTDVGLDNFTAVTDEQGRYEVLNLPPGDYTVQVYRAFYRLPPRRSVTVTAAAPQDLGITKLTSTVAYFGKVAGVVTDEKGQPLDGVVAQLDPPVTESQFTDAAGKFTLDRILPGEYKLNLAAGGYQPVIVPVMVDNKPNFTVTLPAGIQLVRGKGGPVVVDGGPKGPGPVSSAPPVSPSLTPTPVVSPPPQALKGIVTTLAGSTEGDSDGTGAAASFRGPFGLALAPDGTLYVADHYNHRIRKVTPEGAVMTVAGSTQGYADGPGTVAKFSAPEGLALAPDGTLYVADGGNLRIRKVTADGMVSTLAGSGFGDADGVGTAAKFAKPLGLALAPDGTLYVADKFNHRIRKVTREGVVSTLAGTVQGYADGSGTAAKFSDPLALTLAPDGTLFVVDMTNQRIRVVTQAGVVSTLAGSTLGYSDGAGAMAKFANPRGLALAPDGTLYVADAGNSRIRTVTRTGLVKTLAGDGSSAHLDGDLAVAKFGNPMGLAVAPDGRILVADFNSNRIRLIR